MPLKLRFLHALQCRTAHAPSIGHRPLVDKYLPCRCRESNGSSCRKMRMKRLDNRRVYADVRSPCNDKVCARTARVVAPWNEELIGSHGCDGPGNPNIFPQPLAIGVEVLRGRYPDGFRGVRVADADRYR